MRQSFHSRLLPLLVLSLLLAGSLHAQQDTITAAIRAVREKVAPDRRVAVFDVTAERRDGLVILKGDVDDAPSRAAVLAAVKSAGAVTAVDSIRVLPDTALGERTYGIVIVSVGNIRSKPGDAEELSDQVLMGTVVKLLKNARGYSYIRMPDRYLGWLDRMEFQPATRAEADAWLSASKVIMTWYFGVVREQADATAQPVCDIVPGCVMKLLGVQGVWTHVELADGRKGFIESPLVENYDQWKKNRRLTGETIARTAKLFVGVPYLWGGTSGKGMDCSGFIKTVYWLNGMELSRDADQQADLGTEVNVGSHFENSRTGDLLFFGQVATAQKPERITHVAIYLENRIFIHSSGRVRFNSLDPASPLFSESLLKRFVRSRRLF
jgi:uncharacterized protein YgiM (DUF1202 family)